LQNNILTRHLKRPAQIARDQVLEICDCPGKTDFGVGLDHGAGHFDRQITQAINGLFEPVAAQVLHCGLDASLSLRWQHNIGLGLKLAGPVFPCSGFCRRPNSFCLKFGPVFGGWTGGCQQPLHDRFQVILTVGKCPENTGISMF